MNVDGVPWELFETVAVSIDYADSASNDRWRRCKGAFAQALRTVRKLVGMGREVEVFTTLTSDSVQGDNLERLAHLVLTEGVDYWKLNRYRNVGRGPQSGSWDLTPEAFRGVVAWARRSFPHLVITDPMIAALEPGVAARHGCTCGTSAIRVNANGDLSPCTFLAGMTLGNALREDVREIWARHPVLQAIRNRQPRAACARCRAWDYCRGGCYAAAYLRDMELGGPDPQCWGAAAPEAQAAGAGSSPFLLRPSMRSYSCNLYVDLKQGEAS